MEELLWNIGTLVFMAAAGFYGPFAPMVHREVDWAAADVCLGFVLFTLFMAERAKRGRVGGRL